MSLTSMVLARVFSYNEKAEIGRSLCLDSEIFEVTVFHTSIHSFSYAHLKRLHLQLVCWYGVGMVWSQSWKAVAISHWVGGSGNAEGLSDDNTVGGSMRRLQCKQKCIEPKKTGPV